MGAMVGLCNGVTGRCMMVGGDGGDGGQWQGDVIGMLVVGIGVGVMVAVVKAMGAMVV